MPGDRVIHVGATIGMAESASGWDHMSATGSICSRESSAGAGVDWTCCLNARLSIAGNRFPRFSARRRIPAQAVELKKYRCGIEPVSSTCDNEHTAATLGHSEILGVENPPRDCSLGSIHSTSVRPPLPWRLERISFSGKPSKKAAEGVVAAAEDARDVFPDDDAGLPARGGSNIVNCIGKSHVFQGQRAAFVR